MRDLFIGDPHFGHKNAIDFDERPFADVEEMDRILIEKWQAKVEPDDNVWVVGDMFYHNSKPFTWYLDQLPGNLNLIIGNHDKRLLNDAEAMKRFNIVKLMHHVEVDGRHICLCHYPIASWYGMHRGCWHIFSHVHRTVDSEAVRYVMSNGRALNAGCMLGNYEPATLEELIRYNRVWKDENGVDICIM